MSHDIDEKVANDKTGVYPFCNETSNLSMNLLQTEMKFGVSWLFMIHGPPRCSQNGFWILLVKANNIYVCNYLNRIHDIQDECLV